MEARARTFRTGEAEAGAEGQARFATALLDPSADPRIALAGSASPRAFNVHRNTVMSSLVRALAEGFPSVERLVGGEFFSAMAAEAVRAAPPSHPVLLAYGAAFARFVDGFPPVAHLPYLADVARLDGLRRRAWHAADVPPLALEALAGVDPEHLAGRRVVLHPSVGVLGSRHAALSIWAAQNGDDDAHDSARPPTIDPDNAETAIVWRVDGAIHAEPVDAALLALLDRARNRPTLGELLDAATDAQAQAQADAFAAALQRGLLADAEAFDAALAEAPDPLLFDGFLPPFPAPLHPSRTTP